MSNTVISVENVSKIYRLGEVGTGSLAHDVNRWWHRIRGKEDPYLQVSQTNDRTQSTKDPSNGKEHQGDWVYALKDINFEVKQGQVLGIIGRNGAGKSTLLKILSRVTAQTTGRIKVKGRIASLLEVGTGFHPELTGRENIFLNGAILGMRKAEIASKFDEIVGFSGCARYIDTPVKRYSSGMYVRLAFAVAAHLEPDILIVDEVLAVGDIDFQQKCIGKMQEISRESQRTIIFVSHNITAISNLCNTSIYLNTGKVEHHGSVAQGVNLYRGNIKSDTEWCGDAGDDHVRLKRTWIRGIDSNTAFETTSNLEIGATITVVKPVKGLVFGFTLFSSHGQPLAHLLFDDLETTAPPLLEPCTIKKTFRIPPNTLAKGTYHIEFDVGIWGSHRIIENEGYLTFSLDRIRGMGMRFPEPEVPTASGLFRPNWHAEIEYQKQIK